MCLTTLKCIGDTYEILIKSGRGEVARGDLPTEWGNVYNWFRVWLKCPDRKDLEVSPLRTGESPVSSRD